MIDILYENEQPRKQMQKTNNTACAFIFTLFILVVISDPSVKKKFGRDISENRKWRVNGGT